MNIVMELDGQVTFKALAVNGLNRFYPGFLNEPALQTASGCKWQYQTSRHPPRFHLPDKLHHRIQVLIKSSEGPGGFCVKAMQLFKHAFCTLFGLYAVFHQYPVWASSTTRSETSRIAALAENKQWFILSVLKVLFPCFFCLQQPL
ncbi:UNVERIFIED_ORG: hypothetical protein ABRZ91_002687 [Heyndrickxia coagulans]